MGLGCGGSGGATSGGSGGAEAGLDASTGGAANDAGRDATLDATDAGTQVPWYDVHATDRRACQFGAGDKTARTIGPNVPHGDALPFTHIVVLMMENRSFDEYFSSLPSVGVTDVNVATDQDFNYDPSQNPPKKIYRYHETRYCTVNTAHEWNDVHLQYDNGKMDGFVATSNPGGARAMGYYTQADLPYYYWLARTFAISDHNFASLLGPTWPNRFFFYGGTSWGNTKTGDVTLMVNSAYRTAPKILDLMSQAHRSWKIYRDGTTSFAVVFKQTLSYEGSSISTFDSDVDNNSLPNLAIVDPSFSGSGEDDEHPPTDIQRGQAFAAHIINKLMNAPAVWSKTVFFLMYDEHGGFYDHVVPPPACEPDKYYPAGTYRFNRLGIRTPLIVVSPFAKAGYVSHIVTDHTSVTRFIENRFNLPAMTHRDANAWPLLDMFNFTSPHFKTPPSGAPAAAVDPAGLQYCANHPDGGTGLP